MYLLKRKVAITFILMCIIAAYSYINSSRQSIQTIATRFIDQKQFNSYIDKYCPVTVLNISRQCLKLIDAHTDLAKHVQVNKTNETIYYHTFWQLDKTKDLHVRILKLSILSYLTTQDLMSIRL